MTRYEQVQKRVAVSLLVVGLVALPVLIWTLGAFGFAAGFAGLLILKNVVGVALVVRHLGIWPLPGPRPAGRH